MQTFKQWIVGLDLFPLYRNPADFAAAMREEYEKERRMVTRLNLQQKSRRGSARGARHPSLQAGPLAVAQRDVRMLADRHLRALRLAPSRH